MLSQEHSRFNLLPLGFAGRQSALALKNVKEDQLNGYINLFWLAFRLYRVFVIAQNILNFL